MFSQKENYLFIEFTKKNSNIIEPPQIEWEEKGSEDHRTNDSEQF